MPGEIKIGPYVVLRPLGRGGMGAVYVARHETLGREVALKVLLLGSKDDEMRVARFRREAESALVLEHPCLVRVFDYGTDGDKQYLAMELVEGKQLQSMIEERGALPVTEAAKIALQLLEALAACHAQQILHRDVKPANVIIEPGGRPRLLDLGLVKPADRTILTEEGSVVGTPRYMPPEMLTEGEVDERGDIYQVGLVFYECVTGTPFHPGFAVMEVVEHVMNGPPVTVPAQMERSAPAIKTFLTRILERDPAARYQTCAEAIQHLKAGIAGGRTTLPDGIQRAPSRAMNSRTPVMGIPAIGGTGGSSKGSRVLATPVAGAEPPPAPSRRGGLVAALALGAALAAAAAFVLSTGQGGGGEDASGVAPEKLRVEAGPASLSIAWTTARAVRGVVTLPAIGRTEREDVPRSQHALLIDRLVPETHYELTVGDAGGPRTTYRAITRSVAGVVREMVQELEKIDVSRLINEYRKDTIDPFRGKSAGAGAWRATLATRFGSEQFRALAADLRSIRHLIPEADVPIEARGRLAMRLAELEDLQELLASGMKLDLGVRVDDMLPPGLEVEERLPVGPRPLWSIRFGPPTPGLVLPPGAPVLEAGEPVLFNTEINAMLGGHPGNVPGAPRHHYVRPGAMAPPGRIERAYLGFRAEGGGTAEKIHVTGRDAKRAVFLGRIPGARDGAAAERFIRLDERVVMDPGLGISLDYSDHDAVLGGRGIKLYTVTLYAEKS